MPATALASTIASGRSSSTARKTLTPTRSVSRSSPRAAARRSSTSHAQSRPRAAPFAPSTRKISRLSKGGPRPAATAAALPAAPQARKMNSHRKRAEAPFDHRAEDAHRHEDHELVGEAVVHERGGHVAPRVVSGRHQDSAHLVEEQTAAASDQRHDQRRRDDHDGGHGPPVGRDALNLVGAQRGEPRPAALGARLGVLSPTLQLGRALAHPLTAVRALGHVGADL